MAQQATQAFHEKNYAGTGPENYQRYFVPMIGGPFAADLVEVAAVQQGERILDVACGTGAVTRLAAKRAGKAATVAGVDVNPGMIAVARTVTPEELSIDWYETGAEAMPLPDASFDLVTCGMGLQFMGNRAAALAEMHRVLAPGGRVAISLPGPIPPLFAELAESLADNIHPDAAKFAQAVFWLHDSEEIRGLLTDAGFGEVRVNTEVRTLQVPAPADFLWRYVHSTPLAGVMAQASEAQKVALESDLRERWQPFTNGNAMTLEVTMNTATARR